MSQARRAISPVLKSKRHVRSCVVKPFYPTEPDRSDMKRHSSYSSYRALRVSVPKHFVSGPAGSRQPYPINTRYLEPRVPGQNDSIQAALGIHSRAREPPVLLARNYIVAYKF